MAKIKVKNVGNSTVIVPNGRGGDIIILPGQTNEIEEKYLAVFSGKLVEVKEKTEKKEETKVNEPTEEGAEEVEEPKPQKPKPRRR